MKPIQIFGAVALLCGADVQAHHSYAMFDMTSGRIVQGSVAKVEWVNPHVFVWMYVRKSDAVGKYDLFAFENGPVNMMTRFGWSKDTLKAGEKLSVLYFPLRDGRNGGYFLKAVRPDGTIIGGDPHPPGVARELAKGTKIPVPQP